MWQKRAWEKLDESMTITTLYLIVENGPSMKRQRHTSFSSSHMTHHRQPFALRNQFNFRLHPSRFCVCFSPPKEPKASNKSETQEPTKADTIYRLNSPEIGQLERAKSLVDEDVVRFDVRVNQPPRRHVLQRRHELFCILLHRVDVDTRLPQT